LTSKLFEDRAMGNGGALYWGFEQHLFWNINVDVF
jgi:hypothetical protein